MSKDNKALPSEEREGFAQWFAHYCETNDRTPSMGEVWDAARQSAGATCPHGVDDGACKQCYADATAPLRKGKAMSEEQEAFRAWYATHTITGDVAEAAWLGALEWQAGRQSAGATGQEPVTAVVEHDGSGYGPRKAAVLIEQYDPRKPEYWMGGKMGEGYRFTLCYAAPIGDNGAADGLRSQAERIEALEAKCALLAASLDRADRDTERLDFLLAHDAFAVRCDRGGPNPQYQLMNQDEDEDYHVLHNERRFFATEREAIDAAIAAQAGSKEVNK